MLPRCDSPRAWRAATSPAHNGATPRATFSQDRRTIAGWPVNRPRHEQAVPFAYALGFGLDQAEELGPRPRFPEALSPRTSSSRFPRTAAEWGFCPVTRFRSSTMYGFQISPQLKSTPTFSLR